MLNNVNQHRLRFILSPKKPIMQVRPIVAFTGYYFLGLLTIALLYGCAEFFGLAAASPDVMANAFLAYICFCHFQKLTRAHGAAPLRQSPLLIAIVMSTLVQTLTKLLIALITQSPLLFSANASLKVYCLQMSLYALVNVIVVLFAYKFSRRHVSKHTHDCANVD